MISQNTFKDSRLLGALDYIDSGFISDAMKDLKIDIEESDSKSSKRRKIKAYLTLAACLILLSAAFPIINYVLPRIGVAIGGNAGAGTSELEASTTDESEVIDSPYERSIHAYPEGMSAEEIYADVLKGGWVVIQDTKCENITAVELWQEFLNDVEQGKKCSVLIAYYSDHVTIKFVGADDEQYAGLSQIVLTEVKYDGNKFVKSTKWFHPDYKNFYSSEYSYLLNERNTFTDKTTYYLANKPDQRLNDIRYSSEKFSMDSAIIVGDGLITVWEH